MKISRSNFFIHLVSLLLICLFIYSAIAKLADFEKFVSQIKQSMLIRPFAINIAIGIPILEIGIVALLFFDSTRIWGLYLSYSLMILFTCYIITITQFSEVVPCSCGGVLENMSWSAHMYFNLAFVLLSCSAICIHRAKNKKESLLQ